MLLCHEEENTEIKLQVQTSLRYCRFHSNHHNVVSVAIKRVVIFFIGGGACLQFVKKKNNICEAQQIKVQ